MPLQPIDRELVLNLLREHGPIIPNDLKRMLKLGDTILLGAMLSELASKGQVKISTVKIGGSPYYYDPQNMASLEKVSSHLNEKDRRTYALLKEHHVLRDDAQDALTRVSLRNIKDYAIAVTVNAPEGQVLFWKYYLLSDADAEPLIKRQLGMETPVAQTPAEAAAAPVTAPPAAAATTPPSSAPPQAAPHLLDQAPVPKRKKKPKTARASRQPSESIFPASVAPPEGSGEPFYQRVKAYFDTTGVQVLEQRRIGEDEWDFVVQVQSPLGPVRLFCKAKDKKKVAELDLVQARLQGLRRQLSVVFLTTGEASKKTLELLEHELAGMSFLKV